MVQLLNLFTILLATETSVQCACLGIGAVDTGTWRLCKFSGFSDLVGLKIVETRSRDRDSFTSDLN